MKGMLKAYQGIFAQGSFVGINRQSHVRNVWDSINEECGAICSCQRLCGQTHAGQERAEPDSVTPKLSGSSVAGLWKD